MTSSLEKLREYLKIDKNRLDDCLVEQPDVYYQISEALVEADARRDALKLEFEELQSREDQRIRADAARRGEKTTEAGIQNQIRTLPGVTKKQDEFLDSRHKAEEWRALKEAFQQRSFMLRELVALYIAQRNDRAMESGSGQGYNSLADARKADTDALRRRKRLALEG